MALFVFTFVLGEFTHRPCVFAVYFQFVHMYLRAYSEACGLKGLLKVHYRSQANPQ